MVKALSMTPSAIRSRGRPIGLTMHTISDGAVVIENGREVKRGPWRDISDFVEQRRKGAPHEAGTRSIGV
jgi:hypothetical protein